MRILVFGDSITQGFFDSQGGWVQRLGNEYMSRWITDLASNDQPTIFNLGVSGDSSDNIAKRMVSEIEARRWPGEEFTLIFAVGANNSYIQHGKPRSSVKSFEADILRIIEQARDFTSRIIFVGLSSCDEARTTPVDWDDIVWTNERLQAFDTVLQKCCVAQNIALIPVFEKFQAQQTEQNLLIDGLHPNDAGHAFIADVVRPELAKLLT